MKKPTQLLPLTKHLFLFALVLLILQCQPPNRPLPTNSKVNPDAVENEGNGELKEKWFALMHRSADDVDWKNIEFNNRWNRHQVRGNKANTRSGQEVLANGDLVGQWKELGSDNNAGSVIATEYDKETDQLYLISAGGTFWKGTPYNEEWVPLNEDLQFQDRFLKMIKLQDGTKRFVALSGGRPMYSDDEGKTWTQATGYTVVGSGSSDRAMMMNDGSDQIYLLAKRDYWTNLSLYTSTDNGETYQRDRLLGSISYNDYALLQPHHSNDFYFVEKRDEGLSVFYKRNDQGELEVINEANFEFGRSRANLAGYYDAVKDSMTFIAYSRIDDNGVDRIAVYRSRDEGKNWTRLSNLQVHPWTVGIYILPSNPEVMLMGAVECFRTENGGEDWVKVNGWVEYYDDIVTKLHADMMYFNEFEDQDGITFQLISNHGGLNISYNEVKDVSNIGMKELNVGQFYDVQTDKLDRSWVYGGTQDQGFQRGDINQASGTIPMEQVWSGDYGHMAFTNNNEALWTVYPGGLIYRYNDPKNDPYPFSSYQLVSENESVWIPPLIADPDISTDIVYLAGGNPDGGPGSYIIKLSHSNFNVSADKHSDFNFKAESAGGEVSSLAISPLDENLWYAATTNGRFFYSTDRGVTWEQTIENVPGGQYLYGASIFPSPLDKDVVYFAGSGYSNPPVLVSTNGGETFTPFNTGIPATLVIELTGDPDGKYLFAATESGPYVYSFAEAQWFDMAGEGAPAQRYWSVEYLADLQKVRFGTYGRGIWDFEIEELNTSNNNITTNSIHLSLFPNPSQGQITLTYDQVEQQDLKIEVFDVSGKLMSVENYQVSPGQTFQQELDLRSLAQGNYFLVLSDGKKISRKQFVMQ